MTDPVSQHPGALPAGLAPYRRTGEFTDQTLPAGLRRDHSTKAGVWALIHVVQGKVRYCVPAWNHDEVLEPGRVGIVAPGVAHFVEPLGPMRMYVEFHSSAGQPRGEPHAQEPQ